MEFACEGKEAMGGTSGGCEVETKTRHCQLLHHRNHHPPGETLNHFYCIELSLLQAGRTSKRAFSLFPFSPLLDYSFGYFISYPIPRSHTRTRAHTDKHVRPGFGCSFLLYPLVFSSQNPTSAVIFSVFPL